MTSFRESGCAETEDDHLAAEVDAGGDRIRSYTYYLGVDMPHSMRTWENGANGAVHYYALDLTGNDVAGMFDAAGTVTSRYSYAPFGEPISATGTVTNPLRFAAREIDPTKGLYYVRARWYDATLGRFLSEDPIGLAGGINNYAYAANDPVNRRDPSGLDPCPIGGLGDGNHGWCGNTLNLGDIFARYRPGWEGSASVPGYYDPNRRGEDDGFRTERHAGTDPPSLLDRAKQPGSEIAQCTLDHYGLGDLATRGASWLGAVPLDKRSRGMPVMQGLRRSASPTTNALNYYGHQLVGPLKIPGNAGRWAYKAFGSKSFMTLAGRANVLLAAGFLAYDGASVAMCVAAD
jgi:RHS repeat-associated protein